MDENRSEALEDSDSPKPKSGVEEPVIRLKTKPIPIIIVLTAAAIACVTSIMQGFEFGEFLVRLVRAIAIFAVIGIVIKIVLDLIFNNKSQIPDGNIEIKSEGENPEETDESSEESSEEADINNASTDDFEDEE